MDILIRREDFDCARLALESSGFIYRHAAGLDIFLDGATGKPRDAVHARFANEKVHPDEQFANPDVTENEQAEHFRVLTLEALVRIKLTAFRDKDRMHLRDLIAVELLDANWLGRLPPALASRLQSLLDTPNG